MSIPPCKRDRSLTYPHHFTIYLDDDSAAQVRAYAGSSKVRLAEALRELVEYGLESASPSRLEGRS